MMIDWKIHKKLLDAGGLGPVVYICLPRAGCYDVSMEYTRYLQLQASGRTVVFVRPQDRKELLGGRKPWTLRDRDILTPERYERAEKIWNEFWRGKRK